MTGQDLVKALINSNFLDREIENFQGDDEGGVSIVVEESSEYLGNDERQYVDIHLNIDRDGKWLFEHKTWVG